MKASSFKPRSLSVLVAICAVMSVLLAVTNALTAPIIEQAQNAAANEALLQVMPNGEGFESIAFEADKLPKTIREVYKEKNGGYVFKLETTGYGAGMILMCGINADGTVSGVVCLGSSETLGHEKTYGESFTGKDAAGVDAVDTISGATKTTAAYKNAVKDAMNAVTILGGGSVDLRTEEEILNDNLSAALPAGEGKFVKPFIAEVIEGIDAVYAAENGKGYVYVIGEQFFGVQAGGSSDNETVAAAHTILSASTTEDIDLSTYGEGVLPKKLISAKKTATGNYILEVKGAGYGIKGGDDYHPASGEYIVVRVSMTPAGKIIDTFTVSQAETPGVGDACLDEKFYGQFDGKTEENYKEIDAIGGATMTTNGYLDAISNAFAAVTIFEGGTVDLRTEEEILRDNLSAALPAGEGKFTKLFITEIIEGIDAVYTADNGKGCVYVIGEQFIAVDESGATDHETVVAAHAILTASAAEEIDLSVFEEDVLPKKLISAKKTATGNYILEVKGAGYGIKGGDDYHPASGKYIEIRICLSADGKIIDVITTFQEESKGIGDACANEKFYGQFDGKNYENYKEIDAIGGATMTTNGYFDAIENAYKALEILKGGNQ